MRLQHWVGIAAPGRFADLVLFSDTATAEIAEVWADGRQVSDVAHYLPDVPRIEWPGWARDTVNVGRPLTADDFAVPADAGRTTMYAALLRPFHWADDFLTAELAVTDGQGPQGP